MSQVRGVGKLEGLEMILTRRSVRKFTERKFTSEQIEKLLHAGMSAPSAQNGQPYEFLITTDRKKMDMLCDDLPNWMPLKEAVLCIAVVANLNGASEASSTLYMLDCAAAAENILLSAHAMGAGGVWLGTFKREKQETRIKSVFKVPEGIAPVATLALGFPPDPKGKISNFNRSKIHNEQY